MVVPCRFVEVGAVVTRGATLHVLKVEKDLKYFYTPPTHIIFLKIYLLLQLVYMCTYICVCMCDD
jgi:hypothetical protein